MIQWIGLGLTLIGVLVNGYRQYSTQPLTPPVPRVEYYYQAVFDPVNKRVYVLYPDGRWYEQVPVPANQTQYPANLGVGQGSQSAQVGQRLARQPSETPANPWFR